MTAPMTFVVKAAVPQECVDNFQNACNEAGLIGVTSWGCLGGAMADVAAYFEDRKSAEEALIAMENLLAENCPGKYEACRIETIVAEDWQNSWKKFFKAKQVSRRVVVRPSWEEFSLPAGCVEVVIDPGMTFGTGLHPTTRACIRFIDDIARPDMTLLDAGCGSGILSAAAAKLGYRGIRAFDIDGEAVRIAQENFELNAVKHLVHVERGNLSSIGIQAAFDVVAVNILAPVILKNSGRIAAMAAGTSAYLALSGIRSEFFSSVEETFDALGFDLKDSITEDEWTSGLFVRK